MVDIINNDRELNSIIESLSKKESFAVIGGAGSGKTTILIKTINESVKLLSKHKKILCITYTNIAVSKIRSRINDDRLVVSTFHDFFWDFIKQYQVEIKEILIKLIREDKIIIREDRENKIESFKKVEKIEYKEYRKIEDGIISHDTIISLAKEVFENKVLQNRFSNIFPFVFIDEFQDTQKLIVDVFLNTKSVVGFFGDPMQSIYENGVGDLNEYIKNDRIKEIFKDGNYRNPSAIIQMINKLRITDKLQQEAKGENKNIINSQFKLLYTNNSNITIAKVKEFIQNKYSIALKEKDTKILYLTHRLKAKENSYEKLYGLYGEFYPYNINEKLFDSECKLIKHLKKIQDLITLYENDSYSEFLKISNFKVRKIEDKKILQEIMNINHKGKTIKEMIEHFHSNKLILKDDVFNDFIKENEELYQKIAIISYSEFIQIYLESKEVETLKSINATQHGVKGSEFDNIIILLDNGNWKMYDFSLIFKDSYHEKPSIFIRTKKYFMFLYLGLKKIVFYL